MRIYSSALTRWRNSASGGIKVKSAGAWMYPKATYVKISGVWRQMVPENVVMLYDGAVPTNGLLCNGNNDTPNLLDCYINPNINNSPLSISGSHTHNGSEHGSASLTSSTATMSSRDNPFGVYSDNDVSSDRESHSHTEPTPHTHTDTVAVDHRPPSTALRPVIGLDYIDVNAVILGSDSTILSLIALATATVKAIYMADLDSSTVIGTDTHTHATVSSTSSTYAASANDAAPNNATWYADHNHTVGHGIVGSNAVRMAKFFSAKTTSKIYFDQLPSKSICVILTADVPAGWTVYAETSDAILSGANSTYDINSPLTHSHTTAGAVNWTDTINQSDSRYRSTSGSTYNAYYMPSHTHTWTDGAGHTIAVSTLPKNVSLRLIVKT